MRAATMRYRVKGSRVYIRPQGAAYETVGVGRRSLSMRVANYGPNTVLQFAGGALRDQSRDAIRKNGYAEAAVDRLTSNIVGTGIQPQLGSPRARELWARWTDEADAAGALDFYGLQAQVARAMVSAGECFGRMRIRRLEDGLSVPLQIQVLEPEYVPLEKNEITRASGFILQGIEFDAIGRRARYWMYRQHPADTIVLPSFDAQPVAVDAREIVHVYDAMQRPGQVRGEPWLTRALVKLRELDQYDDAELVRKKQAAMLVGFIKRVTPQGTTLEELQSFWGDDAAIADGVGQVGLEPGTLQYLEPGEEVSFNQPADVGPSYDAFMREQKRGLAVAAKLLYEQLTGDFGAMNDRQWRAAFNEFRRRCEMWQHHLVVFQFCRPIWARWRAVVLVRGLLAEEEVPENVIWTPPKWPYINPVQDIEAETKEIRAGLASRSQKVIERGMDPAAVDAEQAADNARADELGVKYDSDGRNQGKAGAAAPDAGDAEADPQENKPKGPR